MNAQTGSLNHDFQTCLTDLMERGLVAHPRGTSTREILNYNVTLRSARNRIITFPARKLSTKYLLGEFIWYLSGQNTVEGILPYSKFWENIKNKGALRDYDAGTINSNYGYRIFGNDREMQVPIVDGGTCVGRESQWKSTIRLLKNDKDTRQAIINIHRPTDRHAGNADVPCTLALQFFIRENKLHLITTMRSNDVVLGFCIDVFQFTMLQECMLLSLKDVYPDLELGYYYHNAGSLHVYERHFSMAEEIIQDKNAFEIEMVPMDRFDDGIVKSLVACERAWQAVGAPEDFEFESVEQFHSLSEYWKLCLKAFFTKDAIALHEILNTAN